MAVQQQSHLNTCSAEVDALRYPMLAPFGSEVHRAWIARRLAKNIRFRQLVDTGSRPAEAPRRGEVA